MAFYKITGGDNRVYGPASEAEMRRWIAEGRLNGQSLVQAEGSAEWRPLSTFPEFADALGQHAAPAPLPVSPAPGVPVNAELLGAEVLASQPTVNIGACLARSWNLVISNFGLIFGATAIVWLIQSVLERIPIIGYAYWLIHGPLMGGLYLILLHRIRNQPASVGDVFSGFGSRFVQLMLAGVVSALLASIGFCFCIVPWLYLLVAWVFCIVLVADKGLEFWSGMELSRKVVTRVWFPMFALLLLVFLPSILVNLYALVKMGLMAYNTLQELATGGSPDPMRAREAMTHALKASLPLWVLSKVVLLFNLPLALGALMYAYEDLFGPRPARTP